MRKVIGTIIAPLVLVPALWVIAVPSAPAAVLDANWTEATWLTTVSGITGMAWAPDGSGRLFLTTKAGQIRIAKTGPPPSLVSTPFATVTPVYTGSECGLIGIAFDPNFLSNGFVYVFVTVSAGEQQIIRYTAVGDVGTAKTTVVSALPTAGQNHDGGGVGFARDGTLYWAIGDLGNSVGVDSDLTSLAAKVGRANPNGSVPPDNPFVDGVGGNNDYIFARGLRNPFTFTFQPETGMLWVDVVGGGYEQIFAVSGADHLGFDNFENNQPEGYITPLIKYRTNGVDTRTIVAGGAVRSSNVATFTTSGVHGFRQGEKLAIAGVANPSFNGSFYVAATPTPTTFRVSQVGPNATSGGGTATTQNQGGAVTGGAFYDSSGAPPAYRGNLFYGDYNSGRIMRAVVGPGTTVTSVDYFATGNTEAIDVSVGPDGALYYVGFGGTVRRTSYNAVAQNLVVSNLHLWLNEAGAEAFTVRLALAPATNVTVNVALASGSTDVNVTGGASLTFTPLNYQIPQVVTLSALDDPDAIADHAILFVSSPGLPTEQVDVWVADRHALSGGFFPGRVPDGDEAPGSPLTVAKSAGTPGNLDLAWSPSCSPSATDYSVHEGLLGTWYSHDALLCSTGGVTSATVTPGTGNRYYLVVPLDEVEEGSYGTDSDDLQRPASITPCRATQGARRLSVVGTLQPPATSGVGYGQSKTGSGAPSLPAGPLPQAFSARTT